MEKKSGKSKTWAWVLTTFIALGSAGAGYAFAWRTFVQWWEPVLLALGLGAGLGLWVKGVFAKLLSIKGKIVSLAVASITMGAICYGGLMSLNYCLADHDHAHDELAEVITKFSEERTRYRRAGRNRMVPSGTYKVYYVKVKFENGAIRNLPVSAGAYTRARVGEKRHFSVTKGFLGYSVFTSAAK